MDVYFIVSVYLGKCKWIFSWISEIFLSIIIRKEECYLIWNINYLGVIIKVNLFIKYVLNIFYRLGIVWMCIDDSYNVLRSLV